MGPGNDLADWYPIVEASGVPTPRTVIVPVTGDLFALLDGECPDDVADTLARTVDAVRTVGCPAFLRTGLLSAKHSWSRSCHVTDPDQVHGAAAVLAEAHALAWLPPVEHLVARELLATHPVFWAFDGMPVTRERRYFARDGVVYDHQPYWPVGAINRARGADGSPLEVDTWLPFLRSISDQPAVEVAELTCLTECAAKGLPGAWSVDWLWAPDRGWVMIDAAHAEESYLMGELERAALTC